jgi:hypothetical protein
MFERDSKHRGERREVIKPSYILILGATVTNAILFVSIHNANENILEVKQAAEKVTNYLEEDGYDNVRNLEINYHDDSFSFTIYDTKHFLDCIGHYEYQDNTVRHIGNVSCTEIDFPELPDVPARSV